MSAEKQQLAIGQRVILLNKEVKGTVAYIGYPTFATGKWVGVVLDEPKGKNNGTVRGHAYFTCEENYGAFVRQTQLQLLDGDGNPMDTSISSLTSDDPKRSKLTSVRRKTATSITQPGSLSYSSSRTSLAGSRQSLVGVMQTSPPSSSGIEGVMTPELGTKRASFIETGFVETLRPQFTLGQTIASPVGASPVPIHTLAEEKLANLQAQQEITKLKAEVEDLQEKLETLRVKRSEDREKLKELPRLRTALEQANEFKAKIMATQAQLQKDLQRAKQETREAQELLEARIDETSELSEAVEMAVLDKEMAEERAEALQTELENCRDKLEEATLDLQLMRAEMEAGGQTDMPYAAAGAPPSSGSYEMKQLEQQNARLKEALVRLRDLSAHDKHQMAKMQKDLEQCRSEIAELSRTKEKLSSRVEELENQIADLHEQVDAALGAEEMVEQLAEKKMELEEKLEEMRQEMSELEALQDVHEQLVESNRDLELDLREELEMAHSAKREAIREKEALLETIADRDTTINKFRELVHKLHDECNSLRIQLNQDKQESLGLQQPNSNVETVLREGLGSYQSRAPTRSIELQLRSLELDQAKLQVDMLRACLPDHFLAPQGDYDSMMLILLLKRLTAKADIINGQIREKFPEVKEWDREALVKSHTLVQYSFRCQLQYHLYMIQWLSSMWSVALERCSVEELSRAASALPDAASQERSLDNIIVLLKADELDENSSLEGVERCAAYLHAMWSALCGGGVGSGANLAISACLSLVAAIHTDTNALITLLQESERGEEMALLVFYVKNATENIQQMLKNIKRKMPSNDAETLHPDLWEAVWACVGVSGSSCGRAAKVCSLACRAAHRASNAQLDASEPPTLPHKHLKTLLNAACEKMDDIGPDKLLRQSMESAQSEISSLAKFVQEKEYDILAVNKQQLAKPTPPIVIRSQLIKKQLEEIKSLTIKLENKELDIKELKRALKAKAEELSELQIRRELGEKRLNASLNEAKQKSELLAKQLNEVRTQLKNKEKEFEETMDHLQQDIDSLENERGALRDKLKTYSKGSSHHGGIVEEAVTTVPSVTGSVSTDTEALQHQVKVLSWSLSSAKTERAAEMRRSFTARWGALRPLHSPKDSQAQSAHARALRNKLQSLQYEFAMFTAKSGLVKFPSELKDYAQALQQHKEKMRVQRLAYEKRLIKIQREIKEALYTYRPWSVKQTALTAFPTNDVVKDLDYRLSEGVEIGVLTLPSNEEKEQTVYLTLGEFDRLKTMINAISSNDVKFVYNENTCAA